ncbi:ATP-binding protein [Yoonia sp. BS5-3]|uniref:AAA family ATPase n=1 Tax=Yoonia phaeophyticola TaxID=3137369 RepID=A0ABZ2V2U7_9RHOB
MTSTKPVLHMLCGKPASGKSTLAARLGQASGTIIISEDDWLNALFIGELTSLSDYTRCMTKLRTVMGPHVVSLLKAGNAVVLDFQANTLAARRWLRQIIDESGAAHQLHVLDVSDAACLKRLRARNAAGDHPFALSAPQFHQLAKHFVMPGPNEGFDIVMHNVS